MGDRIAEAFQMIRDEIAAATTQRDRFDTVVATIRVNAMRLGATDAEIDAMVRGETGFVDFLAMKIDPKSSEARLRALLRRAHDAMSRRDPDGISTTDWDQLLRDLEREIGG